MKLTADTNVLVRAIVDDNPAQCAAARNALARAATVAISSSALCEVVWVLSSAYEVGGKDIATVIRTLIAGDNVVIDRFAVDAGLAMLDAGGDFADGVIAHEGELLGGATFLSLDKRAVKFLERQGRAAKLLS